MTVSALPVAEPAVASAPLWGAALRPLWAIEDGTRLLNHDAFGATPRILMKRQSAWRRRMERNPPRFFMGELPVLLREAAGALARFVGTVPERLAFVANATAGVATVARALPLAAGDEVLTTDHVYDAVRQMLRHVTEPVGARLVEAPVPLPLRHGEGIVAAVAERLSPRARLVVVDHVASPSAVTFPVDAIAALCRSRGIPLLIDGAHAPGLLDLSVDRIGADFYVGNCHKWLCGPKSAGFLAVAERAAAELHPLAISHAYGQGFTAEFDKVGTLDFSAALTVPDAIGFHLGLGGAALRQRNRALAIRMAEDLAAALETGLGADPTLFHAMATVRLPGALPATRAMVAAIRDRLWAEHGIEAAIMALGGALYLRVSAQASNDEDDLAGLADALRSACRAEGGTRP